MTYAKSHNYQADLTQPQVMLFYTFKTRRHFQRPSYPSFLTPSRNASKPAWTDQFTLPPSGESCNMPYSSNFFWPLGALKSNRKSSPVLYANFFFLYLPPAVWESLSFSDNFEMPGNWHQVSSAFLPVLGTMRKRTKSKCTPWSIRRKNSHTAFLSTLPDYLTPFPCSKLTLPND